MSSASFALRFCRLSALAFKCLASKDRFPFFTACLQAVLFYGITVVIKADFDWMVGSDRMHGEGV